MIRLESKLPANLLLGVFSVRCSTPGEYPDIGHRVAAAVEPDPCTHDLSLPIHLPHRYEEVFPRAAWRDSNAPGFIYLYNAWDLSFRKGVTTIDPRLLEEGFLSRYSMACEETDFRSCFMMLHQNPERLFKIADEHGRIALKTELAIGEVTVAALRCAGALALSLAAAVSSGVFPVGTVNFHDGFKADG
jgi:hypothetical protein